MTEQSDVWKVKQGGTSRRCLKHGIIVTGCTLFYECKDCIGAEKELKESNKRQQKLDSPPHIKDSNTKKYIEIPRISLGIGQIDSKESGKVLADTDHRRRITSTNRRRVKK